MALFRVRTRIDNPANLSFSGPGYNLWHVSNFAGAQTTDAAVQAAVDAIRDFYAAIQFHYNDTATITVGESVVEVDATPPVVRAITPRTVVGTASSGQAPAQLALVMSLRSAVATRAGRGRIYLGPIKAADMTTGGRFVAASATTIQTAGNALIAALAALPQPYNLAIRNRTAGGVELPAGSHTVVMSVSVNDDIDTQRRRS